MVVNDCFCLGFSLMVVVSGFRRLLLAMVFDDGGCQEWSLIVVVSSGR